MARIAPFRGLRFAPERVGSYEAVVAPPYDVISPERRETLVGRSPWNIVAVDLPAGSDDRYDVAGRLWRKWIAEGVVRPDPHASLYCLEERFVTPSGQSGTRRGFVASLTLEEFGVDTVAPHERTFAGPKADRLSLMRATRANLSPIFALYRDPDGQLDCSAAAVTNSPPDVDVAVDEGRYRMWVVSDPAVIDRARRTLAASPLTIADGHHRYETALTYRDECRSTGTADGADGVMVYLSPMDDPDLTILAAHRLITFAPGFDMASFHSRLGRYFDFEPVAADDPANCIAQLQGTGEPYRFGLYTRARGRELATLRSWEQAAPFIEPARSDAWRRLDVSVLHELVLKQIAAAASRGPQPVESVAYTVDPGQGEAAVAGGSADMLCILRPTAAHQVADVVQAGDTMPQKSTYFYPKLLTGLVMRSLDPLG